MADKKHNDRVIGIAGGPDADEALQVFKVGQMGSGRRDFLKNALAGAAAGVAVTTIGGCSPDSNRSSQRESRCTATIFVAHKGPISSLAISSDGGLLASASDDQTVKLWSLPDGALLRFILVEVAGEGGKVMGAYQPLTGAIHSLNIQFSVNAVCEPRCHGGTGAAI